MKHSTSPPPGWPSNKKWKQIESQLAQQPVTYGLPEKATLVERIKYQICGHFVTYCREKDISQRQLAKILGVSESRVSEIVHYRIGRYTIDKLISLLAVIRPGMKFDVA